MALVSIFSQNILGWYFYFDLRFDNFIIFIISIKF